MTDTPNFIRKKQIDIFLSKSESDRWLLGFGMIDEVWNSIKDKIRADNPHFTQAELMVELFKWYYKKDFTTAQLNQIVLKLQQYHQDSRQSK